ncbi:hypothetical protein KJ644_02970 [Candidatus Dependentiae bacterium]|nr:hypothetical protein [Candidatus Dependentiae bacterium]MBU4387411.1 hypothetical protein [Candidatus Dependentiae bacterium]MCG2756770.1 hypothetical protein [Candidatus Dependentiae bacterium]
MFKSYIKSLLLVTALLFNSLKPVQIDKKNLFVPNTLGKIKVLHDKKGFSIKKDGEIHRVRNCFVDKEIRNLSSKELMQFLGNLKVVEINGQKVEFEKITKKQFKKMATTETSQKIEFDKKEAEQLFKALSRSHSGYISVTQMSDGEYSLKSHIRVSGGGPFGALVAYWGTKVVAYGGIMVANIVTTGPAGIVFGIQECVAAAPTIEGVAVAAEMIGLVAPTP